MTLTPLHRALGLTDRDLTLNLVRQACAASVQERDDLDWKSTLPLTLPAGKETGRDAQQEELAKDIAAMANSRGGMIVYGVKETAATSAASEITTVGPPDETTLQNIRRVASNLIHPPVTALSLSWLTDDTNDVALALDVGQSTESPHLVRPRNQPSGSGFWFAVPFRNGPHTDWMPEKMIEAAYRDRLANRRQRERDIRQLHTDLVAASASQDNGAWIVAVARPERPLPAQPRLLDRSTAAVIFSRAWNSPWRDHLQPAVSAQFVLQNAQTRRGLRRFRQNGIHRTTALGSSQGCIRVVAELHCDGSVGLALTRGGALHPTEFADTRHLVCTDLDQVALDVFTLARQAAQDLGVTGDYEVRLSVEARSGVLFRHWEETPGKHLREFSEEDRVPPFIPVKGVFSMSDGLDAALESLEEIAQDAVNQTGAVSWLSARDLRAKADLDD